MRRKRRAFVAMSVSFGLVAVAGCDDSNETDQLTPDDWERCSELAEAQGIDGEQGLAGEDAGGLFCSVIENGTGEVVSLRESPSGVVTVERLESTSQAG